MNNGKRFRGTLGYLYAHWPAYLLAYAGVILSLLVIGVSAQRGWPAFIPLALAFMLVLIYFLLLSLWAAHQQYDPDGLQPHHVLFDMGRLQATDSFVYISLGLRQQVMSLSSRLTTGQIIVIDVYNPQWTTSRALARWRGRMASPPPDPRLTWRSGTFNLLPLPDKSVKAVVVCQVLSEFWQHGDRLALLREVYRILVPNGHLLLAERVQTQTNWLLMGPAAVNLPPVAYWRELLAAAGLRPGKEQALQGIVHCFRADRPTPVEAQQLALGLNYE
jgi:hypothetical protein